MTQGITGRDTHIHVARLKVYLLVWVVAGLTACNNSAKSPANQGFTPIAQTKEDIGPAAETVAAGSDFKLDGNTLTYGNHIYTIEGDFSTDTYNAKATGKVTFTNVPTDLQEFTIVYEQLLGHTPHGVAAMLPMAIEMFARNQRTGEQCIRLLSNSESTANGALRILKTKFTTSGHAPESDSYVQRYLAAASLQGASNVNAYTPTEPYTVIMEASTNKHQEMANGDVVSYLYIDGTGGWDTTHRQVEVLTPYGGGLCKVFNFPALYTQCKPIRGSWSGLK